MGYTFNREIENERAPIVDALERLEMNRPSSRHPPTNNNHISMNNNVVNANSNNNNNNINNNFTNINHHNSN
jgi:hypothetical protein